MTSYWLIERPVGSRPLPEYWSGNGWTDDPWQAQRFASRKNAMRLIRASLQLTARAVSHGFDEAAHA